MVCAWVCPQNPDAEEKPVVSCGGKRHHDSMGVGRGHVSEGVTSELSAVVTRGCQRQPRAHGCGGCTGVLRMAKGPERGDVCIIGPK